MRIALLIILFPVLSQAATKDQWISYYLRDCKKVNIDQVCKGRLEDSITRMNHYRPMVLWHLKKYNLPSWLAVVPIMESDYNKNAFSTIEKGGKKQIFALGKWQISWKNIQKYFEVVSLTRFTKAEIINSRVWANPEFNTELACWILDGLYKKYKNWKLVLYAYNAGTRSVDDWVDGGKLPLQTINFYEQFVALNHIISNQEKYEIQADDKTTYYAYVLKNELIRAMEKIQ